MAEDIWHCRGTTVGNVTACMRKEALRAGSSPGLALGGLLDARPNQLTCLHLSANVCEGMSV